MKIAELYQRNQPTFSFEFFPPKTPEGEKKLFETISSELKPLGPSFVSVTYGAMGTTRDNTIRIVERIKAETGLETAAHLTCIAHTKPEIARILEELHAKGIENIVALRGDIPQGETEFKPPPNGFRYGRDLVAAIRAHPCLGGAFAVAVAGYPETHIECRDKRKDMARLKQKVDAGADVVITQLFFKNDDFFNFVDRAGKSGIKVPIVAGIMPVTNGKQIQRFASMCGALIPKEMQDAINRFGDDNVSVEAYGVEYASRQCRALLDGGVPGIHFYTLNKSRATRQIYINLGLARPR